MDVSFVLSAARRRWWVVVLCMAIGAAPFFALEARSGSKYESTGRLFVTPPSDAPAGVSFSSDPDRYIVGQLGILRSESLASTVASSLKDGHTVESLKTSVAVASQPGSDIVTVTGSDKDPKRARKIVDAYINEYFRSLRRQINETQKPELDSIDQQVKVLTDQLALVDAKIERAIAPYLPGGSIGGTDARSAVPTAEQVAPDLSSQKATLLTRYNEIVATRTRQEIGSRLRVTSQVVERATLPTIPTPGASPLVAGAGIVAGAFAGIVLSALLALRSSRVLDPQRVQEALGVPVVGSLKQLPSPGSTGAPSTQASDFLDVLRVRADGYAARDTPTRVLVASAGPGANTAGLAAALADRYAAEGVPTLLVDRNSRNPELTKHRPFGSGAPGSDPSAGVTSTNNAMLSFAPFSVEDRTGGVGVQPISDSRSSHVLVIDGGSLLSSGTAQLAQSTDVVVLAIPLGRQRKADLRESAGVLRSRGAHVLPVITPASAR